jgi:CHAT domain-containing protein/Tfp pilus assembly protein PilF
VSKRKIGVPRTTFLSRVTARLIPLLFILFWLQCSHAQNAQASTYRLSLIQQQTTGAESTQEVTTLEFGKPVERELVGGQKHIYQFALTEGQYVRVEVRQLSIDVGVLLHLPDGKTVPIVDIPGMMKEPAFGMVAESSGVYKVSLFPRSKAPLGRYEIRIAQLRPATKNERELQEASDSWLRATELAREGKYLAARPYLVRALEIRERLLEADSRLVVTSLGYLAANYEQTGDYATALSLTERAFKIDKLRGDQADLASDLYDLGRLYKAKGDYLKAEEMFQGALGVYEKANQSESIVVSYVFSFLGDIYYDRGDYAGAENYYERSRATLEKLLGPDHYHLHDSFVALGRVAYDAGDYSKAEVKFQRALALSEKALGQDNVRITGDIDNLAMLYCTTGEYAKAEALYQRALSIEQKAEMINGSTNETLFGLARLYAARGMPFEAVKFQAQASEIEERYVELNLAAGSEREKLAFLANLSWHLSRNISLHTRFAPNDPVALNLAVTTILQRKGRTQDAMSASFAALRRRFGAEDQRLLDQLSSINGKLANLVLNSRQKMTAAEHQQQIKMLEEEKEDLEEEISNRSAGFYKRSIPVVLAEVQAAIPDDAALVEFAVYRPFDPRAPDNQRAYGEPRYVAYVIRKQGEVRWTELGEAKEIDHAVEELRKALRDPKRNDVKPLARAVDEIVMQGVRSLIGKATRLLISPDGALNLMPFEALVDEQGSYLVEHYSFTYLTSGRDLLRLQVARKSLSNPLIMADPSFGQPASIAKSGLNGGRNALTGNRSSVTTGSDLTDVYFAPVTVTAQEGRSIKSLFPEALLLTGNRATEASLKQVAAPRILHIASHGFFLTDTSYIADTRGTRAINARVTIGNPLLRSGLALAGANLRKSDEEDGILTALEASGLNLWGTKLVTLSACDTGIGEVKNGEGVYGLRRAFMLAGTETLVMSLWPVSDYVTRGLMTNYYKGLKLGQGRREALRQVQLNMLKRKDLHHPFYWASFIQSGEWANLDGKR